FYKQCGPGLCENGKSSCITTTPSTKITIEEAEGTIVNVQKGDIITANLKYTKDETIELQYDSVFALDTSTCLSSFTIKGSKQCRFTVSNSANPGKYKIGLKNGQQTTVKVVSNPSVIILTNKPKLYIRFNNAGVYDLLKQAYSYADGKQAVVYDLDDYLTGHPWTKLDDYKEKYDDQQLKDNSYSLEVSQFIAEKCNECSTLILGDDFVVPHYRRDLDMSTWFGLSQKTDETYSDIAYIQRTTKTFAEFEELFYQKDKFDGKNVLVVLPDNVDTAKRKEIDKLENFLKNHNEIKAKISEKNASDVVCNSKQAFSYYDGYTLIIVGTSKTNGALNCFPFVIENDLETITIERNPWDGRAYAIVVNSDNTDLLTSLNGLLDNGTYKQLDSSGWLIARTTANVAVGIAIGSLALGASPVVLLIAGAASVAADSIDGAECWKFKGSECTEFVVGLAIPFGAEKVGKPLIKSAIDTFGPRLRYLYEIHGESIIGAIKKMNKRGALAPGSKTGKYFKSLTDEFDVRTIKKYLSKEEADIAQEGTELLGDEFSLALKDFEPKLPKEHRLNLLKYAGDSEQAIRYAYQNFNEIWVPFVPKKGTFLFRGDNAYSYNPSKSYPGIHRIAEFVPLEEHAFKNVFNALIPTTKDLTVAAQHAVKRATSGATFETYILVINPRALNGIDIDTSYHLTHGSQLNFLESEVGIVSNVNTREIVGVIKGKVSYLDGSVISRFKPEKFEPNPAYVADSSNPFDYKKAMEALK
ncbi:MAG TPA: hypothetical protein VI612_03345, partial [Candidatus Nanoarchaeia archaeon]|nr:hypothetical protein [Candidatus Nanoarchaeia archaeon]